MIRAWKFAFTFSTLAVVAVTVGQTNFGARSIPHPPLEPT